MSLVIDSSMTLAWYFEDEKTDESTAVLHQVVVHSYLGGCPGREIRILVIGQALYSRHSWSGFRRCNPSFDRLEPEAKTMLPAEIG